MSLYTRSQIIYLSSLLVLFMLFRENKKPCLHEVSRVEKIYFVLYLLTMSLSKLTCCSVAALDRLRLNTLPGLYRL